MYKINNYERYKLVSQQGIISNTIQRLIESHSIEKYNLIEKYERYKASEEGVPIFSRSIDYNKVNNKINNDFFSEIVDTKVGYMVGKPIVYNLNVDNDTSKDIFSDFLSRNSFDDLDADTMQMMAICGKVFRLCYIDPEAFTRVQLINPWEVIMIYDEASNPVSCLRYFETLPGMYKAIFYTRTDMYTFDSSLDKSTSFVLVDEKPHMFLDLPMIEFVNNAEKQGDCDKVLALIDDYDRTTSDVSSEIEQFRLSYLALMGISFTEEDIEKMKQTGAVSMPIDSDAKFITKDLNDAIIEHKLDRSEKNILRFSRSVNFTDSSFATSSGIALKYKLQSLENKALKTERKFSLGTRQMFKVLSSAWGLIKQVNYLDIWWQFKRNVPIDILDEAESTNKLKGFISEDTRLSMLSFVDDVEFEKNQMIEDVGDILDLDRAPATFEDTDEDNNDTAV